jgi:hypothetical protein
MFRYWPIAELGTRPNPRQIEFRFMADSGTRTLTGHYYLFNANRRTRPRAVINVSFFDVFRMSFYPVSFASKLS